MVEARLETHLAVVLADVTGCGCLMLADGLRALEASKTDWLVPSGIGAGGILATALALSEKNTHPSGSSCRPAHPNTVNPVIAVTETSQRHALGR